MNKNHYGGYLVYCGTDGEYFRDAAGAMRFAAFMGELGYDALYYDARIVDGKIERGDRVQEHVMRECVRLGL